MFKRVKIEIVENLFILCEMVHLFSYLIYIQCKLSALTSQTVNNEHYPIS